MILFATNPPPDGSFVEGHSGEILILTLFGMTIVTLYILVPQLLRAQTRRTEMQHTENMKSLECGLPLPPPEQNSRIAGQMAMLVPMVVLITAGTVTCFMAARGAENLVAVALTVWCVGGVVSLAAITGGVALMGRLAQLQSGEPEEQPPPENPLSG